MANHWISLIGHLADFGVLVVLWLVQLVIYPSFLRIQNHLLVDWHQTYTFRVSFVIMPLMLVQLGLGIFLTWTNPNSLSIFILGCILVCWALTFFVSVPLHNRIGKGEGAPDVLFKLIKTNWPRTIIWSLIFLLGLYRP